MQPGDKLAHYEIDGPIGKGGMGEVYRARDTKLGRDVAIKVLPTEMSKDPERLARFDREARTLATLQHANVASIYGFETDGATRFLVMELAEGEDLSARLQRGAMPHQEVVGLTLQIANGLAAAHAVGIIHRDLKPANIKISSEGKVKILDFGLARAAGTDESTESPPEHSPTITAMTQPGVILGTAAYMSPEQARGKSVDHRADIWAFGIVLFGMLSGRPVFEGETVSDTLAGVLRAEVPWDQLPKDTSPTLRRLLERCLDRDPARRLQAIGEARIALEDMEAGRTDETIALPIASGSRRFERMAWITAVVALVALAAFMATRNDTVPALPMVQSTLLPPDGWDYAPASPFAVSPDGSQVVFEAIARPDIENGTPGTNSLWIRHLDRPEARQLAESTGSAYPFWSPDGQWVGFFSNGKLSKVEARGGPIILLCDAANGRGGAWNDDGVIVFQRDWSEGLMTVAAGGGSPVPLTTLDVDRYDIAHRWPTFLPDGGHFLFYIVSTTNPKTSEHSGIYLGSLDKSEPRFLMKSESRGTYSQGHLLFRAGSTLMARPFDPSKQEFTGDSFPVSSDIPGGGISWGGAQFGVSLSGVIVHMRGAEATSTQLGWRDRTGKILDTIGEPGDHWELDLSLDGKRLAVAVGPTTGDIWILDLEQDMRGRFTFDPADERTPLWSPDGSQLAFVSTQATQGRIYVRPASGQGEATLLHTADNQVELSDWSNDGRLIFFNLINPGDGGSDIWILDMETGEAEILLTGDWFENANLSPDGKWLAFTSQESGKVETYVQSFPEAGGRWMVSSDKGSGSAQRPIWRRDGRELFYLRGSSVMIVPVSTESGFSFGEPKVLFGINVAASSGYYAPSEDGKKILTNEFPPTNQDKVGARLIQNWTAGLAR
jgi:serine/threonine protein kinase